MITKRLLASSVVGTALVLAAAAVADEPGEPDECGANILQDRIGEAVTGSTTDDLQVGGERVVVSANAVRVVGPGDAMTMDFRSDRLTIDVDEDGNLVSARCV